MKTTDSTLVEVLMAEVRNTPTPINEVLFYAMAAAKNAGDRPIEEIAKWTTITELYVKIAEQVINAGYLKHSTRHAD